MSLTTSSPDLRNQYHPEHLRSASLVMDHRHKVELHFGRPKIYVDASQTVII
uniref:Uncharacterized protein n=1 Tax=Zea mays TaxID=4577 RepID=B4FVY5_MAIZE|nr:unknown [Zea mays]